MKVMKAKSQSWRDRDAPAADENEKLPIGIGTTPSGGHDRHAASPRLSAILHAGSVDLQDVSTKKRAEKQARKQQRRKLSVRAENVLKILAVELTGEEPPRGRWVPSELLLQRLSYKHLATARNCGPQTTAEIIEWARGRGTDIRRSFHAGKSFAAVWQRVLAKCSTGEVSKAEIAEALETSTRRKNTRIPVALQKVLLQFIRSPNG
jgi:hypothetical protein